MLIRHSTDLPASEITPREDYLNRRALLAGAAGLLRTSALAGAAAAAPRRSSPSAFSTYEKRTSL